jgi:hypothetical protein
MATLEETLKKLGLATARGVPQLATGFVDLAALPFTATGMLRPEQVFGSTDYLTSKGLLPPPQKGLLGETTELVSSALNPAGAAKTIGLLGATKASKEAMDAIRKMSAERTPTDLSWVNNPVTPNPPNPSGVSDATNYMITHRPMTVESGAARLHEASKAFGEEVYGNNALQYFGSGLTGERTSLNILKNVRGNPEAEITIYRGVPKGVKGINEGDWVTLDPKMAAEYGNVVSKKVKVKDITTWPDSLVEFGYYPSK